MDLVWPIDQDTAGLVCSSEPVFGFVLGGDPDRLARVKGEAREPTGPGAAAGITSLGFLFSALARLPSAAV